MSMMMVQVDVMCCKSVGTDLSMLDIDDLMTEICQLKKEVKLLETKLRERDQLNRKDVCGVSLCDFTDQTSPDLLLSVCDEEQKTSVKLLDCEMELKTQIKEEQTDEDHVIYSDLMEVKEEKPHHLIIGEESLSRLNTEQNFVSKNSLIAPDKQSPSCPQCGKIFTRKSKLSRHMRIHTGERPYRCEQCGKTFTSNCHLKRHLKIHTKERPYRCDQCGRTFIRKVHLKDHMRLHNGEKPNRCDQCGMMFFHISMLQAHMTRHTEEKSHHSSSSINDVCGVSLCDFTDQTSPDLLLSVCNEEQKTSVKLLDCEMELKTGIKKEQTNDSDVIYSDLMEVKEESSGLNEIEEKPHHLITGEESVSFLNTEQYFASKNSPIAPDKQSPSCPQCGKIFTRKSKLSRHMRIHTGERPYRCEQCGMTFTSNCHLKRHLKIHTGERSYKCDQCGRTFIRKDHLKDHMRLHTGAKSHHCSSCGRCFKDSTRLETHRKKFCQESQVHLPESVRIRRSLRTSEDVCGVSLCDFTDQTSPDLLLSVCNEEQKTSVKLLDCEMELKTQIKEEQTDEDHVIYSDLMEVKEENSEPNEIEEKPHYLITGVESLSRLNTEQNFPQKPSQIAPDKQSPSCPQCGKIFTHKSKLSRHMRIHTGERPYRCEQCGMTFTSNCHLKRHLKIHTGERSYRCDQCGRTFIRKDHLKDHMRLHNGAKSHHCSSCGRCFKDSTRLETHRKKCYKVYPHETVRIRRSLRFSGKTC